MTATNGNGHTTSSGWRSPYEFTGTSGVDVIDAISTLTGNVNLLIRGQNVLEGKIDGLGERVDAGFDEIKALISGRSDSAS